MLIRKTITKDTPLTEEQIAMLEALKNREPVPDEDCPEITPEMLKDLVIVTREEREKNRKKNISIRLSSATIDLAKSTIGKGYTTLFSTIIEKTLNDKELLKHFL